MDTFTEEVVEEVSTFVMIALANNDHLTKRKWTDEEVVNAVENLTRAYLLLSKTS